MTSMLSVDKTSFIPGIRHFCLVLSQKHYYLHAGSHCQNQKSSVRETLHCYLSHKHQSTHLHHRRAVPFCRHHSQMQRNAINTAPLIAACCSYAQTHTTCVCLSDRIVFGILVTEYCTLAQLLFQSTYMLSMPTHDTHIMHMIICAQIIGSILYFV